MRIPLTATGRRGKRKGPLGGVSPAARISSRPRRKATVTKEHFIHKDVARQAKNACWKFQKRVRIDGVQLATHYYLYGFYVKPVPATHHLKRACRTPGCCNFRHYRLRPGVAPGRARVVPAEVLPDTDEPTYDVTQPPDCDPRWYKATPVVNKPDDPRIRPKGGPARCWRSLELAFVVDRKRVLIHRYAFELYTGVKLFGKHLLRTCDRPDCYNPHHYRIKNPSPEPLPEGELSSPPVLPGPDRRLVTMPDPDACWRWQGSHDPAGYGQVSVRGKTVKVHRFAYEEFKGPVPVGVSVIQTCKVRDCYNPSHLELGDCRGRYGYGVGPRVYSSGWECAKAQARDARG